MNNGNVTSVTNNITPGRSQSYTGVYPDQSRRDELNRVSTALSQATSGQFCWGQDFTYDAWANLKIISADTTRGGAGCGTNILGATPYVNNQFSDPAYHYDAAGNVTADGSNSYIFNAENQVTTVGGVTYTYDGGGSRVMKSNGKIYWNGDGGEALDETDASGNLTAEYIFFGGVRIARRDASNNVVYYFSDHLGTAHVVTNATGTILDDSDFYPFGGERVVTSSSGNAYKFTGKERDTESGLDNFGARYYASTTGRFLSPDDTKYASLADPQTWNLYSYVSNHPLTMTDPTGHSADPWAGRLGTAEYNSFTQEMQGGGVGSVFGGDSGGADGPGAFQQDPTNSNGNTTNSGEAGQSTQQKTGATLSPEAEQAIEDSPLTAKQAVAFEDAVLDASAKTGVDPNILVGLAAKESGLGQLMSPKGMHKGLFQIEKAQMREINKLSKAGITTADLTSLSTRSISKVVFGTAKYLEHYVQTNLGAVDPTGIEIGISSWRVGANQTVKNLQHGDFFGYLDPHLKEYVGDYIDKVERFVW